MTSPSGGVELEAAVLVGEHRVSLPWTWTVAPPPARRELLGDAALQGRVVGAWGRSAPPVLGSSVTS
jgi:hypothetical protein